MPGQQSMIEKEFDDYTNDGTWTLVYHQIKNQASITHKLSQQISRLPANRDRNRYRDVSPYDDYRVKLENTDNDYVNASLVKVPISKREYILTQGPLMNTSGHFWLMVWQQNSLGVLMLNRIVENNRVKCHLYFPLGSQYGGDDMLEFPDVGLTVDFVDLENFGYYCKRTLKLTHLKSGETRKISQYHYTSWPDFDVPDTPTLFLDFLYAVRDAGLLSVGAVIDGRRTGPPVIHCSAGIGRSGTFCLVDSALVVVERTKSLSSLDIKNMLIDMRQYRCGLIQTAEQLRFSYLAILEGAAKYLRAYEHSPPYEFNGQEDEAESEVSEVSDVSEVSEVSEVSDDSGDDVPDLTVAPPLPPRTSSLVKHASLEKSEPPEETEPLSKRLRSGVDRQVSAPASGEPVTDSHSSDPQPENDLRKRREEKKQTTQSLIDKTKSKMEEQEARRDSSFLPKYAYFIGAATVAIGAVYLGYTYFSH